MLKLKMIALLAARSEVERILNFPSLQMGEDVMVAVKARMHPAGSEEQLVVNIKPANRPLNRPIPRCSLSFFEPDLTD